MLILVLLIAGLFALVAYLTSNPLLTMSVLTLTIGWMLCLLVGLAGLTILWQIWIGKIDMSRLFSEGGSRDASFSRFQFFIFTFVIAMSLFLVIVGDGTRPRFPTEIPAGILMLLGISSGSYLVSKGITEKGASGTGDGKSTSDASGNPSAAPLSPEEQLKKNKQEIADQLKALGEEKPGEDARIGALRVSLKKLV